MLYYNSDKQFDFFQNTNLSIGDNNAAFKNEIVTGYFEFLKVGLSTTSGKE